MPYIRPGGRLPGGKTIEAVELRGIASAGMVCSADELGLSPDRTGIYVLDEKVENGTDLRLQLPAAGVTRRCFPRSLGRLGFLGMTRHAGTAESLQYRVARYGCSPKV